MTGQDPRITERIRFLRRLMARRRMFAGPMVAVPLVNVALLVILFFVINSAFVLQPGVVVNLPTSSFTSGAQYGPMVVMITQEGMVFFNDERTTIDGLQSAFAQMAFESPDTPLIIEADGQVRNATIVRIYNMAMAVGVRKVLLATRVSTAAQGVQP